MKAQIQVLGCSPLSQSLVVKYIEIFKVSRMKMERKRKGGNIFFEFYQVSVQSHAACSRKCVPAGYIPSLWLLTERYRKKAEEDACL